MTKETGCIKTAALTSFSGEIHTLPEEEQSQSALCPSNDGQLGGERGTLHLCHSCVAGVKCLPLLVVLQSI